ncbi:MAG TPA: NADPH-dependent FMN reductase [Jatrophihabitans sp.]|jgi:FMN reductase
MASDQQPLVVGIGGSTGATSTTSRLLADALQRCADRGARTELLDADVLAVLPIFTVHGTEHSAAAERLADSVRRADAVLIATPGYHGGISGLVKNAIDYLELLREDARPYLEGRAVGVIAAAAGWQAVGSTLASVRSTVHALRGWPTPFAVGVNTVEQQLDDLRVTGALDILADQVLQFCRWQAAARASTS